MDKRRVNRASRWALVSVSVIALLAVLRGYFAALTLDEGAAAHIFQGAVGIAVPAILVFLFTADWRRPVLEVRRLASAGAVWVVAFGALFYLEHFR